MGNSSPLDDQVKLMQHAYSLASVGGTFWLGTALLSSSDRATLLVLMGPLVAVPLALPLCLPNLRHSLTARLLPRLQLFQLLAALLAALAILWEPGLSSGVLASVWFTFATLFALWGVLRIVETGCQPASNIGTTVAIVYLAIGGGWLALARFGVSPIGFSEPLVTLTAGHFHFAGFAMLVIACSTVKRIDQPLGNSVIWGTVFGMPLVALGITLNHLGRTSLIEFVAALGFACVAIWLACLLGVAAKQSTSPLSKVLAFISSGSLMAAMLLAIAYAFGHFVGRELLSIQTMLNTHAVLNVFGFSLPALLFLLRETHAHIEDGLCTDVPWPELTFRIFPAREGSPNGQWDQRPIAKGTLAGPHSTDTRDEHRVSLGTEKLDPLLSKEVFDSLAEAISRFDIFSTARIKTYVPRDVVHKGDTLVCIYRFPFGLEMELGSRVMSIIKEQEDNWRRQGFVYQTLSGHPFAGEETFLAEHNVQTGEVFATISSWSRPQSFAVRLLYPWVRWLQLRAGRAGVQRLKENSLAVVSALAQSR